MSLVIVMFDNPSPGDTVTMIMVQYFLGIVTLLDMAQSMAGNLDPKMGIIEIIRTGQRSHHSGDIVKRLGIIVMYPAKSFHRSSTVDIVGNICCSRKRIII